MMGTQRRVRRWGLGCWFVLIGLAMAGPVWAVTIDFEDWSGGPGPQNVVDSRGFGFHTPPLSVHVIPGTNNDTYALQVGGYTAKMLPRELGSQFTATQLDLHEGFGGTVSIDVIGYLAGGGHMSQKLYLDGDTTTFETFTLTGFSGIGALYFYGHNAQGGSSSGFAMDNLVVPEPGSFLLVFSAAMIAFDRKRRAERRKTWGQSAISH